MRCARAATRSLDRASICDKSLVLTFFFCLELRAISAGPHDRVTTCDKSLVNAFFFFSNCMTGSVTFRSKAAKPARLLCSHFVRSVRTVGAFPAAGSALRQAHSDGILHTRGMALCGPLPVPFLVDESYARWFHNLMVRRLRSGSYASNPGMALIRQPWSYLRLEAYSFFRLCEGV